MTSRFIFTEEAERQLLEILEYVADENESAAVRVRHAIHDAVEKLADTPGIGHTREDLTDRPVKFWSVYSYLVVYDPERPAPHNRCSTRRRPRRRTAARGK